MEWHDKVVMEKLNNDKTKYSFIFCLQISKVDFWNNYLTKFTAFISRESLNFIQLYDSFGLNVCHFSILNIGSITEID